MAYNKASSSQSEEVHENLASNKKVIKTLVAVFLASSTNLAIASESDKYITPEQQHQITQKCDSDGDLKLSGREVLCGGKEKNRYLKALEDEYDKNIAKYDKNIAKYDKNIAKYDKNIAKYDKNIAKNKEDIRKLKAISEALKHR